MWYHAEIIEPSRRMTQRRIIDCDFKQRAVLYAELLSQLRGRRVDAAAANIELTAFSSSKMHILR